MSDSPNSLTLGLTTCDFLTSPVSVFLFCYYVTSSENAVVYFAMENLAVFFNISQFNEQYRRKMS